MSHTQAPATNIAAHLPVMAERQPGAPAVIVQGKPNRGGRRFRYQVWTAQQLDDESNRVAHGLHRIGVTAGTRTVLMVTPSLEFFALTFGLFKAGAVPVMVDPGMGLKNLKTCLDEAEPHAFIGIPKAHAARVVLRWAADSVRVNVTVGPRLFWGGHSYTRLRDSDSHFDIPRAEHGDTAAILFTSGSTGVPKGAVYTHEIFNAQVQALRGHYGIQPGERDLATFPLFALFGPALGMASVVPHMDASRPITADPRNIIAAIHEHECTNLFASPALIEKVGRYATEQGITFPTLKRVISAGAPATAESLARFQSLLSEAVEIFPSYGATEALPVASIGSRELLDETARATEQGAGVCIGRPIGDVQVKIIPIRNEPIPNWSDDLPLPVNEIGEIAVCGPIVTQEYFRRPEATEWAKIHDPATGRLFHRMGDVGYRDESGRLWFCGRKDHRVVTAKETLYTIPCERIFNTHPRVRRSALVAVRQHGETAPVLCLELNDPVNINQLKEELMELGKRYPHTASIQTFLQHPGFPMDPRHNAKIFREKLARWAQERLS